MINAAVIGATGYTGIDVIRLLSCHPHVKIKSLIANSKAGQSAALAFPHFSDIELPELISLEQANWQKIDVVFSCLPHGTSQEVLAALPKNMKIIDLSADFRLQDPTTYQNWYGRNHGALDLQKEAVYGLTEYNRDKIRTARLIACPGCYPTATLMALLPGLTDNIIKLDDIIIDAKSGLTGAGRGLKEANLFCEIADGLQPYAVASHRHAPEIEQEICLRKQSETIVSFNPHLIPMNRGELVSCYVKLENGATVSDLQASMFERYADEPFVSVVDWVPATRHVRGSNFCLITVKADRVPGRAIIISTLDNLVKGSSGQAVQNMNLMFGFDERDALRQQPMFP